MIKDFTIHNENDFEYLRLFKEIEGFKAQWILSPMLIETKLTRSDLMRYYSFAIPNKRTIKEIVKYSPIIELGAGSGYWAFLIQKYGGNIVAFDNNSRNNNWYNYYSEPYFKKIWFDVKYGNENEIKNYIYRTLFLCWVEYQSENGLNALKLFKGKHIIHIGEGLGGCTATKQFSTYLDKHFRLIKEIEIPQWYGIHDYLTIHERD